ncbi:MAG: Gfo/Idh/MocA family oxidoreductase [Eggerthellaceae bacterium]|nr:Gfo/Idh/MocA family oxidoreductase [Eggerthellaceae bacterium]
MKYALIGCGRIATNHITAARDNDFEIVALCDVDAASMESLLAKHGLEKDSSIKRYTDYQQMLAEESSIELIAIATESGIHARIALDCIKAHKHLIIEKPIAMSINDANEIVEEAKRAGVLVAACHQNRFNDAIQKLRHAVESGRFGKISHGSIHVRWNRRQDYYTQAPWRGTWEQDGGCLMNQCIHGIDLLCWMMESPVESVYAQTRKRFHDYIEAEDIGMAVLTFANGSIATIEGTTNVYPENLEEALCLFGQDGTVKIGGKSVNAVEVWKFIDSTEEDKQQEGFSEQVLNIYGNGHTLLYADMKQAIVEGRKPYVDAVAGRGALEVVLAMYKSQKTGLPVRLPLEDFSSEEMQGEFS